MYPKRISSSLLIYPLFWYFSQGEAYLHITINTIYPPLSYEFQLKYLWKTCNSEVWGIDGPSLLVKMKYSCCLLLSRHHSRSFIVSNQASIRVGRNNLKYKYNDILTFKFRSTESLTYVVLRVILFILRMHWCLLISVCLGNITIGN